MLAGLGLNDEEYINNMIFKDGKPSVFCELFGIYCITSADACTDQSYVKDIQSKICENAAAEYHW